MHSLAITEQGIAVRAEGDLLLLERKGHLVRKVRVNDVDQVLVFGRVELSSGAVSLLLRRGVDLMLLNQQGVFRGRLSGRSSKNVGLRLAQYRNSCDPQFCLRVARTLIAGKIRHQRQILLRAQRRIQDEKLATAIGSLRLAAERALATDNLDTLRGLEGHAAATYFGHFNTLIRNEQFSFQGRNRQPPRDPVNALLSFGYAVVGSMLESDAYRCGLDPMLGLFHQPAYGRPSLSLDLLEEFRPLVDTLVLKVINRKQLGPQDFERRTEAGLAEVLKDDGSGAPEQETESLIPWLFDGAGESGSPNAVSESSVGIASSAGETDGEHSPTPRAPASQDVSTSKETGPIMGVFLADMGRRIFLHELFRRLRDTIHYPRRNAAFELRDILREQMYHLARVIEGQDLDYTPFVPD